MKDFSLDLRQCLVPVNTKENAYFELGRNWFAYRMLDKQTIWSVGGTVVFATIYCYLSDRQKWSDVDKVALHLSRLYPV